MKFGATQQLPEIDRWGQMGTDGDSLFCTGLNYT
jgi:hypothetical protein